MLTRCRKGLVIVSSKSFLRTGGKKTLLGKLEQEWVKRLGNTAWVDWRQVAGGPGKCKLPHSQDTVTMGPTPVVTPTLYRPPLPTALSPPITPPTSPRQARVSIQPPLNVSGIQERQRSPYSYATTSAVPEQLFKQTVVNHGAPPASPQASVGIQPPPEISCIEEKQRSPYNYMTTSVVLEQPSNQMPAVVDHGALPASPPQASAPLQPPPEVSCIEERQRSPYHHSATSVVEQPSKQGYATTVVNHGGLPTSPPQASVSVQPPAKVPGTNRRRRSTSNRATTSRTPGRSLPALEQPSTQTRTRATAVNHRTLPTSPPQASVSIPPPAKVSSTKEGPKSTSNYTAASGTPRQMYNHTPVQSSSQSPNNSDEGQSFWGLAGVATAAYVGYKLLNRR